MYQRIGYMQEKKARKKGEKYKRLKDRAFENRKKSKRKSCFKIPNK